MSGFIATPWFVLVMLTDAAGLLVLALLSSGYPDLHRSLDIERAGRNVGIDNVERLAAALGVGIGELFG